jgi:hypothetical protein
MRKIFAAPFSPDDGAAEYTVLRLDPPARTVLLAAAVSQAPVTMCFKNQLPHAPEVYVP